MLVMVWHSIAWFAVLFVHEHCCWDSRFGVLPRRAITLFLGTLVSAFSPSHILYTSRLCSIQTLQDITVARHPHSHHDGAKVGLLRWKEWWMCLCHSAVTLVSLDPMYMTDSSRMSSHSLLASSVSSLSMLPFYHYISISHMGPEGPWI